MHFAYLYFFQVTGAMGEEIDPPKAFIKGFRFGFSWGLFPLMIQSDS